MTNSVQFVDSIASSPTVRLDLADGTVWNVVRDGTDFSPPPLRRVVTSNMMEDGGKVPSSAYDLRQITLELLLNGSTADAAATQLQALYRELDRAGGNILRLWLSTTLPVFFKTFRASASAVNPRMTTTDGKKWAVRAELLAEPFGYGLLETPVSAATLDSNPANSNGQFLDVTGVKGDVETPAMIRWPVTHVATQRETLFAIRRRGTPSAAPFLFQAEALTQGTNTTTQANDALFSGSGNNWSRCTFTSASMLTRLTLTDLGTASVDLRGRYRLYLRYRKSTSTDDIHIQADWGESGFPQTTNDTFTCPDTTSICMADLGLIQVPRGWDPVTDLSSGTDLAVSDTFTVEIQADRTAGAGNLDFDYLLLVPADDRLGIVHFVHAGPGDRWWLSAADNSAHSRNSSNQVVSVNAPGIVGGLPMLAPNQTNRVYISYEVGSGKATTLTTTTVTISYYPRYLSVRPAST